MVELNIHGHGTGDSSPIPGAKFNKINTNLQKMQEDAATAAMQSSVPWMNPHFKRINTGIQRMVEQEAAKAATDAKASLSATIPWMNPKIMRANAGLQRWVEREAAGSAAEAKASLSSSIPWMNPKIMRVNAGLQRMTEREASNDYNERVKEFTQNARFAVRMSNLRERQQRAAFGQSYREAQAEDRARAAQDPNTYRAQNARRLGSMGQRAIEQGRWREMHESERELGRIEQEHGSDPRVAAAARAARARINAAREGQSPWRMRMGQRIGAVMDSPIGPMVEATGLGEFAGLAAENPYTALLMAGVKVGGAAIKLPFTNARLANSVLGPAQPYMEMRKTLAGIGRGAGINSQALEAQLRSDDPELNRLGIGPADGARMLHQYGIGPSSPGEAVDTLKAIGSAQYMPAIGGLGMDTYVRSANFATNAGFAGAGQEGASQSAAVRDYFQRMAKAVSVGVADGSDRASVYQNIEGLLRQSAASGATSLGNGQSVMDLSARMLQGGTAGARMGVDAANMMAAANAFPDKIGVGGNPFQVGVVGSYISTHGGPAAFADPNDGALIKLIGKDNYDALSQTAQGRTQINDLHQAAATSNALLTQNALGPLIRGRPDALNTIANGSNLAYLPGYYRTLATQNFFGVNASSYADYRATLGAKTSDDRGMIVPGLNHALPRGIRNNNPLNLSYLPGQGAIGSDGRFGVYATMEQGISAETKQLGIYQDKYGVNTVRGIINRWGPASDNNNVPAYIAQICKATGFSPDQPLNLHDATTVEKLVASMGRQENGRSLDGDTVHRGVAMGLGLPVPASSSSPYPTIADPNDVSGINTANARGGQLNMNTSQIYTGMAIQGLSGDFGKDLVKTSDVMTGADLKGIQIAGDGLNGLASAADGVVKGLGGLVSSAERAAAALDKIAHSSGGAGGGGGDGSWLMPGFHINSSLSRYLPGLSPSPSRG